MNYFHKAFYTLLLISSPIALHAQCLPSVLSDKILPIATYTGDIGNKNRITMSLIAANDGKVTGRYAYKISTSNIVLAGKLSNNQIVLTEYNTANQPIATFTGAFPEHDPRGIFNPHSTLQCEVITGTWKNIKTGETLPFYLSMGYKTSGSLDHMYQYEGIENDETINKAAMTFQQAVAKNDKQKIAKMIDFPILISFDHKEKVNIKNQKEFLKYYDRIFIPTYKEAIQNEVPRLLFSRYDGVALGAGLVWFNTEGKIIALNIQY